MAKSIKYFQEGSPDHSLIEAFKIIENDKNFNNYYKYYALRNILVHSPMNLAPCYRKKTVNSFNNNFNNEDFDYIDYDAKILNLESNKTKRKLNEGILEFIKLINQYLGIEN